MTREEWNKLTQEEKQHVYLNAVNPLLMSFQRYDYLASSAHALCNYCGTDWDCAARPSCPASDDRYAYFQSKGADPRLHLKGSSS